MLSRLVFATTFLQQARNAFAKLVWAGHSGAKTGYREIDLKANVERMGYWLYARVRSWKMGTLT